MPTASLNHVSPALLRLRGGIAVSSVFVAACLILQMLVFGFVHFTSVRFEAPAPKEQDAPLKVITSKPDETITIGKTASGDPFATPTPEAAEPRVPSRWDGVLRNFANTGAWFGSIAAIFLFSQLALTVAAAAGASTPGVDRIVSGFHWGLLVVLMSLPLQNLIPSLPSVGVFTGYETMTSTSERAQAAGGDAILTLNIVGIPFFALFALIFANLRLRAGVRAGVIIHAVSQLDERIEEELLRVSNTGVGSNIGPRAVGVLGSPIGQPHDSAAAAALKREVDDLIRGRRPI